MQLVLALLRWITAKVRWLFDLVYGGIPADFDSAFDLEESVKRLSAVTRAFAIFSRGEIAQGEVSKEFVSICRPNTVFSVDMARLGPFEPHFKGEFSNVDGKVRLSGRFTLGTFMKVFCTAGFGFPVIWTAISMRPLLAGDLSFWWFPLVGIGSFALLAGYVWLGKECWRSDIPWLSNLIRDALSGKQTSVGPAITRAHDLPHVS